MIDFTTPGRVQNERTKLPDRAGAAVPARDTPASAIDHQLEIDPLPGGDRTEFVQFSISPQRQALGRDDDLDNGILRVADREPVPPRGVGGRGRGAELKVDKAVDLASLLWESYRLGAAVRAGSRGNAHARATPGVEMLQRALRCRCDGDWSLRTPGGNENTVASSIGRSLQFEVAVDVGERAECRRRWGTIERHQFLGEPGDIGFEIPPATVA